MYSPAFETVIPEYPHFLDLLKADDRTDFVNTAQALLRTSTTVLEVETTSVDDVDVLDAIGATTIGLDFWAFKTPPKVLTAATTITAHTA
jgi:hypothetical protein